MARASNYSLLEVKEPKVIYDIVRFCNRELEVPFNYENMISCIRLITSKRDTPELVLLFEYLQQESATIKQEDYRYTMQALYRMLYMMVTKSSESRQETRLHAIRVGCETEQQKMNNLILEV